MPSACRAAPPRASAHGWESGLIPGSTPGLTPAAGGSASRLWRQTVAVMGHQRRAYRGDGRPVEPGQARPPRGVLAKLDLAGTEPVVVTADRVGGMQDHRAGVGGGGEACGPASERRQGPDRLV